MPTIDDIAEAAINAIETEFDSRTDEFASVGGIEGDPNVLGVELMNGDMYFIKVTVTPA